jgi:hypothetical protein
MATLIGARTVARNLRSLAARVPMASARALNSEAEATRTDAVELTPSDTGRLHQSARVVYASPADLVAKITYGTNYALAVHEIPPPPSASRGGRSARHKSPTQWKFLETAVDRRASKFSENIAADIRKQLR